MVSKKFILLVIIGFFMPALLWAQVQPTEDFENWQEVTEVQTNTELLMPSEIDTEDISDEGYNADYEVEEDNFLWEENSVDGEALENEEQILYEDMNGAAIEDSELNPPEDMDTTVAEDTELVPSEDMNSTTLEDPELTPFEDIATEESEDWDESLWEEEVANEPEEVIKDVEIESDEEEEMTSEDKIEQGNEGYIYRSSSAEQTPSPKRERLSLWQRIMKVDQWIQENLW